MHWSPEAIVAATDGVLRRPRRATATDAFTGIGTDSRQIEVGQLFVAIRAERDGHEFIAAAVEAGCGGVLVERADVVPADPSIPFVLVGDTSEALLAIGRAARAKLSGPVVGITGSVGKTSTKDLTAAAVGVQKRTTASYRSFNNELGVPLTLANAPESTEVAIIEMGSRGPGHIAKLCRVAQPTIGVVTAVAAAHTELFGDVEAVAQAKGELVEALPPHGSAVLNADDHRVAAMADRTRADVITYSVGAGGPARSALVVADQLEVDDELRPRFVLRSPWGTAEVRLEARGVHQVPNALAALSVAAVCGVDLQAAAAQLAVAGLSPWRMDLQTAPSGASILNDAYNANPASMAAALRALASLRARRRVAVVGEMAELGAAGPQEHRAVAGLADELGIKLIAVATDAYGVAQVSGIEAAEAALGALGPDDAVLIKASRVAGLERLAARLLSGAGGREAPGSR